MKKYWLFKSEPDCYSIEDFAKDKKADWTGIRNYQARNLIRDDMNIGDEVLFYHSSANPTGVYGLARISTQAHGDTTALDKNSEYYDLKSTKENPIWYGVEIKFVKKLKNPILLNEIKLDLKLKGIMVAAQGSRLSVQPVSENHFKRILELGEGK